MTFRLLFSSYSFNSLSCGLFHISSEKHSLIFFFSFVIFPCRDVLVCCNHPLWLNISLFPVFHCYKQCCDVHTWGSRDKGRGNFPEAKSKVCAGLPWRLTGKESTCQCRRHRFLIPEDPTWQGATKTMHHNYWACSLELRSHNHQSLWEVCPESLQCTNSHARHWNVGWRERNGEPRIWRW